MLFHTFFVQRRDRITHWVMVQLDVALHRYTYIPNGNLHLLLFHCHSHRYPVYCHTYFCYCNTQLCLLLRHRVLHSFPILIPIHHLSHNNRNYHWYPISVSQPLQESLCDNCLLVAVQQHPHTHELLTQQHTHCLRQPQYQRVRDWFFHAITISLLCDVDGHSYMHLHPYFFARVSISHQDHDVVPRDTNCIPNAQLATHHLEVPQW
mmetsp:Transcript_69058/g.121960  ORF Transcript_69058/g.121960 Transcript_69058/m.121960 type:complete len:207 (-) Transcript_69058:13654-14274(-)